MGSDQNYVDFVTDHLHKAGEITTKKMFGEYGLYCNGKFFASVCDNKLFIKPTEGGRNYIGDDLVEAPPYPGAQNNFLIEDKVEDADWLGELIRITVRELPEPKKRKKKK